jgi:hypothetical protein
MRRAFIALLTSLMFLGACSDASKTISGQDIDPQPPAGAFDIDAGNALAVTAATYGAAVQSGDMAGLAGSVGGGGDGGLAKASLEQQVGGILQAVASAVPLEPVAVGCANEGGSITFTFDVIDILVFASGMFSAGDTVLIEYVNCDEGFGEIINGTIDATVNSFAGDVLSGAYQLTMAMNLADFQIDIGSDVFTSNGDATASLDTRVALYVSASVSGGMMTTDANSSSEVLTNYSSAQTLDLNLDPTEYTLNASGTLDSTQLDGIVAYSTPVEFLGFDLNNPHQGEFLVTGETGSARLIAQANAVDVIIEVYSSSDGSGDPIETINTTWAELAAM